MDIKGYTDTLRELRANETPETLRQWLPDLAWRAIFDRDLGKHDQTLAYDLIISAMLDLPNPP